ncbi:MAG: succinyldiaminopimelate transaminase [Nitrospirota bacterium]|nr:succinyldiaminopimelate transaminase [Nitrospirota bacterium]
MNPHLSELHPYPFERLRDLLKGVSPADGLSPISLGIGEPALPAPELFLSTVMAEKDGFSRYPTTAGDPRLRQAICGWLSRRYGADDLDPARHVVPCAGTREALFSICQAVAGGGNRRKVLMPNPFYQIYEGAALWAGAEPVYVAATEKTGFLPDYAGLGETVLRDTALLYLCSPNNPTGAVAPVEYMRELIRLSARYGFVIVSDECYGEIYPDESTPPPGILGVARDMGHRDYTGLLAFHSLSKRSSLPGARSGFVAGDAALLASYLKARTYFGSTIPLPIQYASAAVWGDEAHVVANRAAYRRQFDAFLNELDGHLPLVRPQGGFCLWARVPGGGEAFSRKLFERCNITVLPGAYLARPDGSGVNPGADYVRMALVEGEARCAEAARRMREVL